MHMGRSVVIGVNHHAETSDPVNCRHYSINPSVLVMFLYDQCISCVNGFVASAFSNAPVALPSMATLLRAWLRPGKHTLYLARGAGRGASKIKGLGTDRSEYKGAGVLSAGELTLVLTLARVIGSV
jgi:hypothetical protein